MREQHYNEIMYNNADTCSDNKSIKNGILVFTAKGWQDIKNISIGDQIYTRKGTLTEVINAYDNNAELYILRLADGREVQCCKDHLWIVEMGTDKIGKYKEKVMTTKQLADYYQSDDSNTDGEQLGKAGSFVHANIPYIQPVQFSHKQLPVEPYILGAFLANNRNHDDKLVFKTPVDDKKDVLKDRIANMLQADARMLTEGNEWQMVNALTHNDMTVYSVFKDVDGYAQDIDERYIDEHYLWGDISQRTELLQGILDVGGLIADYPSITYLTASRRFAQQLQYLVRSLGMTAIIQLMDIEDSKSLYVVTIFGASENVFTMESKQQDMYDLLAPSMPDSTLDEGMQKKMVETTRYYSCRTSVPIMAVYNTHQKADMRCLAVDDDSHSYVIKDFLMTHDVIY